MPVITFSVRKILMVFHQFARSNPVTDLYKAVLRREGVSIRPSLRPARSPKAILQPVRHLYGEVPRNISQMVRNMILMSKAMDQFST